MEIIDPIRMIFGFAFTIALLLGAWVAVRRFAPGVVQANTRKKNLAITEALQLDTRRRLVIIKDHDQEHLILLGVSGETVLQTRPAKKTEKTDSEPA